MDGDVLVKVERVSKKFCRNLKRSLWYGMKDIASEYFLGNGHRDALRDDEFWALKDVSFELRRGECLGLIGHNGAGKSTLLKILNGLIKPDKGKITMKGRIGALIELGAGFNPILTGRENVYINGQILGFSRKEIDDKFDRIVEFSEIKDFIDMPVQNYSSGMKVRLGFAVAAQMEPDVLIIDEVLAVGDLGFQVKCYNRINDLLKTTAVLFVSHNMQQIARLCDGVYLMNNGLGTRFTSDIYKGIETYYDLFSSVENGAREIIVSEELTLLKTTISHSNGTFDAYNEIDIEFLDRLRFSFDFRSKIMITNIFISISFLDRSQRPVASAISGCLDVKPGLNRVGFGSGEISLTSGIYSIILVVSKFDEPAKSDKREILIRIENFVKIKVAQFRNLLMASPYVIEGKWTNSFVENE